MNQFFQSKVRHRPRLLVFLNQSYLFFLNWFFLLMNFSPGIIRALSFRMILKKCGKDVYFDSNVYIKFPWLVEIGSEVRINRGVEFYPEFFENKKIVLGSKVIIAPHVRFFATQHSPEDISHQWGSDIVVEDGVWIGANATILSGVRIGRGSIVGAGSLVCRNVPEYCVVAGNPAKIIRDIKSTASS